MDSYGPGCSPVPGPDSSRDLLAAVATPAADDSPVASASQREEKTRISDDDDHSLLLRPESSSESVGVSDGDHPSASAAPLHC
jgi:hypothetical protein